jgi:hypothetical protein
LPAGAEEMKTRPKPRGRRPKCGYCKEPMKGPCIFRPGGAWYCDTDGFDEHIIEAQSAALQKLLQLEPHSEAWEAQQRYLDRLLYE